MRHLGRHLGRHPRMVLAALVLILPAVALAQDALPIPSEGTLRAGAIPAHVPCTHGTAAE